MDYETFKQAVEQTKQEQPHLLDDKMIEELNLRDAPASDEDIRLVEKELGAILPEDYVRFLKEYGGGLFGYMDVYSAQNNGRHYILNNQPLYIPQERFVAFSDNGCGDYYGFRVIDGVCQPTVVFYDHEVGGEITTTEYDGAWDFCDFVARYGLSKIFFQ